MQSARPVSHPCARAFSKLAVRNDLLISGTSDEDEIDLKGAGGRARKLIEPYRHLISLRALPHR
jgi:hypothetical protein